jgi:hypothetical protein
MIRDLGHGNQSNKKGPSRMDLDAFITETLRQIVKGVREAQSHDDCKGALINPIGPPGHGTQVETKQIDFDVALIVSEGNEKQAKGSIGVAFLGVGGQSSSTTGSSSVSRIKFSVPMILPIAPPPANLPPAAYGAAVK